MFESKIKVQNIVAIQKSKYSTGNRLFPKLDITLIKVLSRRESNQILKLSMVILFVFNLLHHVVGKVLPLQNVFILLIEQVNELAVDLANNAKAILASLDELFTHGTLVAEHTADFECDLVRDHLACLHC